MRGLNCVIRRDAVFSDALADGKVKSRPCFSLGQDLCLLALFALLGLNGVPLAGTNRADASHDFGVGHHALRLRIVLSWG